MTAVVMLEVVNGGRIVGVSGEAKLPTIKAVLDKHSRSIADVGYSVVF